MRKASIPILSTLILGLVFGPVEMTSAAILEHGVTWWSVPELLEYYHEVEAERMETCGDDFDCNMEFESNYYERSEKYRAMHNIIEGQIWVTAINPATETITVLFYDDDMMMRHMGIEEHLELEHLYFGWFEEWKGQIYNYDHDGFTNGTVAGSHPLYDSTVEDLSIIKPWEEVELSVAGGNLIDNHSGKIDYAAFAKYNMFNAEGHFDYSSCLNAEDYVEGMECRLMSSSDMGTSYFPPRDPIIIEDEPSVESGTEEEPITIEPATSQVEEPTDESSESLETGNSELEGADDVFKTPETGVPTEEENAIEFPWWLGAIFALNGLTLVWLFLPANFEIPKNISKKEKHNHVSNKTTSRVHKKLSFSFKKCQKTLDKIPHLR